MFCSVCGRQIDDADIACRQCGSVVPASSKKFAEPPGDNNNTRQAIAASIAQAQSATDLSVNHYDNRASRSTESRPSGKHANRGWTLLAVMLAITSLALAFATINAQSAVVNRDDAILDLQQQTSDLVSQRNQLEIERDKLVSQRDQIGAERDRLATRVADPEKRTPVPTVALKDGDAVRVAMRSVLQVRTDLGAGSAFKWRQRGTDSLFVTNAHVIYKAKAISLLTADGTKYAARLLGKDDKADLAVLAIEGPADLPVMRSGDASTVRSGDPLYVIGFPLGPALTGDPSVSRGVVSGRRTIEGIDVIQTDAAMNPGNSGGPVLNSAGEVIGVAVAGIRDGTGIVQGINFAIPSNTLREVFDSIAR